MAKTAITKTKTSTPTAKRPTQAQKLKAKVEALQADIKTLGVENTQLIQQKEEILTSNHELAAAFKTNQTRLQLIVSAVLERFDGDGDRDLEGLDGRINAWWVIRNFRTVAELVREIVIILKGYEEADVEAVDVQ